MRGKASILAPKSLGIFGIIGEQPMEQTFNDIKKYAYDNDTNCCTVIASAIAFNQPFEKVQKHFFDKGYRKRGKGFFLLNHIEEICNHYNYKYEIITNDRFEVRRMFGRTLTPNTIADYLDLGTYLIGIDGHIFTLKNGKIEDWTKNRKHWIERITRVEPIKKVKSLNISKTKFDFSQF